jgi:DNA-binding CsgD family transcriptional regulator
MEPCDDPPFPLSEERWGTIAAALKLSPRQKEIVELILRNQSDKQIALAVGIKQGTLRTQMERIFDRTGTASRLSLVLLILRISHGVIGDWFPTVSSR